MLPKIGFSVAPGAALFKYAPVTAKTRPLVESLLSLGHALYADMRHEEERLKTFDKWPITFITPQTLARNGFYYLGRDDEVRCAFCKVEIMQWVEGDDPARDHQRWAPQCPFLRKQTAAGTLPAGPVTDGQDECGVRMPGPVHPRYASEASRLRTFKDWQWKTKPEVLAEAGFYYTGYRDGTICFYCGGGLKDWEEDDVPWEQHARCFDRCAYVQLVKGRDYVQKVLSDACVVQTAPKPEVAAPKPKAKEEKEPEVEDSKGFSVAPGAALFKYAPVTAKTRPLVESLLSLGHALYADMRHEEERLKTFDKWPITFITPQTLARNGFYYLGCDDEVRCAFCKVEIMRWVEGDDPARDHQKWSPQCPFLRKQTAAGTLPAGPVTDGQDECGVRVPGAVHPRYASKASRLRTFKDWQWKTKPEVLAEAGFYYTGHSDETICFYCGGGLKDWEEDDVPWEQHARCFDRCAYVQLVRGRDYVQKVISDVCIIPETKTAPKPEVAAPKPKAKEEKGPEVEDRKLCRICYVNQRNVCFVPCGHVVACAKCALATDKCPMCRRTFTSAVRLYYS